MIGHALVDDLGKLLGLAGGLHPLNSDSTRTMQHLLSFGLYLNMEEPFHFLQGVYCSKYSKNIFKFGEEKTPPGHRIFQI